MPSLNDLPSTTLVKLLLLGDAKVGKTTSLVALVKAGYWLGILDYDNLLQPLKTAIERECPELMHMVEVRTLRDKRKMTADGPVIDGPRKAFIDGIKMMDHWKYGDTDHGKPSEWGPKRILVLDGLSRFCDAAYDWREPLTPKGSQSGQADARATYGDAQDAVENTLAGLTSPLFETNVIVICHGQYMDLPDGTTKIFPQGVGQKLSPKIPQYFPSYVRYTIKGDKRTIQLKSDALISLANPRPDKLGDSLPAETGLATFFEMLQGKLEPNIIKLERR